MMRKVDNVFFIGSFVDGDNVERQRKAGVRACLKCTDQPMTGGQPQRKFDFHKEYINLPFRDDGQCPTDNPQADGWAQAKDWLRNVEAIARANGWTVLVHSWTGLGKAIRLIAAHLAGWDADRYNAKLAEVCKATGTDPKTLLGLSAFDAELRKRLVRGVVNVEPEKVKAAVDTMSPASVPTATEPVLVSGKVRKGRTRRPKLD